MTIHHCLAVIINTTSNIINTHSPKVIKDAVFICTARRGDAEEETASQDGQRWQDDSVLFTSAVYVPLAEQIAGSPVRTGSAGVCRAAPPVSPMSRLLYLL